MALSERLAFLITANGSTAVREFEKVGKSAEKNLGGADARLDKFSRRATVVGAGMVAFAGVAGAALFKFAQASEEANRSQLLLDNTLANMPKLAGETSKSFTDLAQSIQNKTAADGDAIVAAEAMLGTFQTTGKQIRGITPLVVDYARKFGVDMTSAAIQVGKALDGQIGALKRNGVSIDANLFKTDRYAAVTQALRDQVGGFAEEEGKTFAGSLERLKNQLGDLEEGVGRGVVDAFSAALGPITKVTGALGETSPHIQRAVGGIAAIGTTTVGAVGGLSLMAGQLVKLRDRFTDTDAAGVRTINTFGRFAQGAGIVGGLGAIGYAMYQVGKAANDTTVDIQKMASSATDALAQSFEDFEAFQRSKPTFTAPDMEFTDKSLERFRDLAEGSIGTAKRLAAALKAQGYDTSQLDKIIRDTARGQRQANADMHDGAAAADDLAEGFHTVGDSAATAAAETVTFADALALTLGADLALGDASDSLSEATQTLADDLSGVGDSASSSAAKVYTFQDAMHDTFDSLIDANEAALDYEDSVDGLSEALGQLGLDSENAADFMDRFFHGGADDSKHSAREVARATDRVVKSAEAEVDAMVASGEIADTAAARKAALRQKLVELGNEFPQVKAQIDEYIGRLDKIPNLTTNAETATEHLSAKKKNLKKDIRDVIKAADDEATALEGTGTELDKAARHHGALLMILGDLKTRFPELAAVIQDYVNDINTAYEDFLNKQGLGTSQFGLGSFGLGGDAVGGGSTAPAPTPAPAPSGGQRYNATGVTIVNNVSGDGLHSDEVADLVTTRTKRALVGARVA